jgi:hypothetical protein
VKGRSKLYRRDHRSATPPCCNCGKGRLTKPAARQIAVKMTKDSGETVVEYKCPTESRVWHVGHPAAALCGPAETREDRRAALAAKQARLANAAARQAAS